LIEGEVEYLNILKYHGGKVILLELSFFERAVQELKTVTLTDTVNFLVFMCKNIKPKVNASA